MEHLHGLLPGRSPGRLYLCARGHRSFGGAPASRAAPGRAVAAVAEPAAVDLADAPGPAREPAHGAPADGVAPGSGRRPFLARAAAQCCQPDSVAIAAATRRGRVALLCAVYHGTALAKVVCRHRASRSWGSVLPVRGQQSRQYVGLVGLSDPPGAKPVAGATKPPVDSWLWALGRADVAQCGALVAIGASGTWSTGEE